VLDRQVAKLSKKNADYEDAILAIEREKASWAAQMADLQRRLDRENAGRLKVEDAQLKRDAEFASLQDRLERSEQNLVKAKADYKELNAEAKILRSLENKTVVEHVYVLEAAKRLTDRQLADARVELQSLKVYVKSLEKAKAKDVEDVTRQRNGPPAQSDQASSRSSTASDSDPFQTQKKLEEMRQLIRTQVRAAPLLVLTMTLLTCPPRFFRLSNERRVISRRPSSERSARWLSTKPCAARTSSNFAVVTLWRSATDATTPLTLQQGPGD
jgi:biopolymer transport protein ExbB/TolQ